MSKIVMVNTIPSEGCSYKCGKEGVERIIRGSRGTIGVIYLDGSVTELPASLCRITYGAGHAPLDPPPKTSDHKEDQPETPE